MYYMYVKDTPKFSMIKSNIQTYHMILCTCVASYVRVGQRSRLWHVVHQEGGHSGAARRRRRSQAGGQQQLLDQGTYVTAPAAVVSNSCLIKVRHSRWSATAAWSRYVTATAAWSRYVTAPAAVVSNSCLIKVRVRHSCPQQLQLSSILAQCCHIVLF